MTQNNPDRRQVLKAGAGVAGALAFGVPTLLHYPADAAEHTLKFASLAPQGSLWYKAFDTAARQIKEKTDGAVAFNLYGGGVMGDERAMVRKIRSGQLDCAAITSVGMGDVDKQLLVLQLPLVFKSNNQLDNARNKMSSTFDDILTKKNFVRLGWGDVGFVYLFSNTPVATPNDAKATKMWVWDTDPVTKEVASVAGINATALGVPDVLPSLSTGVINAFFTSPYAAMALQWHTKAKYVTDLKLAVTIGGTVMSKGSWDKLSGTQQSLVKEISFAEHKKLLGQIRSANDSAQKKLISKHGYTAVPVKDIASWKKVTDQVRKNLTGKLFPESLVNEMMASL